MKYLILLMSTLLLPLAALADTSQSRDGEGNKIQGAAYNAIRSISLGTKGFGCMSTVNRIAWEVKVVGTATTDGVALGSKLFYNEVETVTYPLSGAFFQWQNAPVSKSPVILKVCQRAYSSATLKTMHGIFQ